MMRKKIYLSILMILALFFSSCSQNIDKEYVENNEVITGGFEDEEAGMNIKDIDISYYQNQTEIAMNIIYGSRQEVQSEAIITKLPKYEVFILEEPYRLCIRLYGIDYVDYIEKQSWALGEHVVGVFRERIANQDYTTVYFQLTQNARFKVLEGDGKIRVLLNGKDEPTPKSHFVMLNAFDEYIEGLVSEDYGLTPVMCTDKTNISLISKPFATSELAESFLTKLEEKIENSTLIKKPYSLTLAGDILPVFNSKIDFMRPENKKMISNGVDAITLPVKFESGKMIAESVDKIIFTKAYIAEEKGSSFYGEQLWLLSNEDKKEPIDVGDFNYIKDVSFSHDGRYIAFIDVGLDTKVLYVYDFENQDLYNLGEEGFGIFTYSFTWALDENSIYAITGNVKAQISKCTFTSNGIVMHALVEQEAGEGKLVDYGDQLIYADNLAGEFGIIYSIDKYTGEKTMLTDGMDFKISKDQNNLAVIEQKDLGEESAAVDLKIYSLVDSQETVIASDSIVESYDFFPSSNMLLYADGSESDYTYRYGYALQAYDLNTKETKLISNMTTGEFILSKNDSIIYLLDYTIGMDGLFNYTTYEYNIDYDLND